MVTKQSTRVRDHAIHNATFRRKLKPRREPYWRRIDAGMFVGFRAGPDTWLARWTDSENKFHYQRLGTLAHMDFGKAKAAAEEWFKQCGAGIIRASTVEDACKEYVANRRVEVSEANANDAAKRLNAHVYGDPIARITLDKLGARDVERWRDGLMKKTTPEATRRTFKTLRAALNRAFRLGEVATDSAWKRVRNVTVDSEQTGPETYLTLERRRAFLNVCPSDLADLLRAVAFTAARPQEIASATVADFDRFSRKLVLRSRKGQGSKLRVREFPLANDDAYEFFKRMAKDKLPTAPLLTRSDGSSWYTGEKRLPAWVMPIQRLRRLHKFGELSAYDFRHAAITDLCNAGVSPANVARLAGTSTEQIDRHYLKFVRDVVDVQLARVETV